MKILVLGGSGILSSAVCKEAIDRGFDVTCITRGNRDFALPNGVKVIHGDVNRFETIESNLNDSYDALLDFLTFNTEQLKDRLNCFSKYISQYLFVSSATAYKLVNEEITENTPLGNQFWDYGENKAECEKYLNENYKKYGINYTIIRPYITYGNTRIPFAIIPDGEYWTLANRILGDKPVLLWDNGSAICTLTHVSDFAKGFVSLIGNSKAFGEAYHITSDERLKWIDVLNSIGKALEKKPNVFSVSSYSISKFMPEYKGILFGDKARNRVFDNTKIKSISPEFHDYKKFDEGIKETVNYFLSNKHERKVNFLWDGRLDNIILKISKRNNIVVDKKKLKFYSFENKYKFSQLIKYYIGRYDILYYIYAFLKRKKSIKLEDNNFDRDYEFHYFGIDNKIGKCDFGLDKKLISIKNNVYISNGVKFINYHPTFEHFDNIFNKGKNNTFRELGPIIIEDNVYIGNNVTILPNTYIGMNSLILENSVLNGKIPENSVVMGNPGKVICSINEWYDKICNENEKYPWIHKGLSHEIIVKEREKYFFGENNEF